MVYRPPKHKPATVPGSPPGRLVSDTLASPAPKSGVAGASPLPGDDRNLVKVDENYAGGDIEDRFWVFWRKHANKVYGAICVLSVVVILWQGVRIYTAHVEAALQTEFAAANGAPALTAFAQAHPDTGLGKLAQLEAADTLYKEGKFKEAADAYVKAATLLGDDEKAARARLGQAMAVLHAGDTKGGTALLEALANDSAAVENLRAESAYDLAILAAQAGDKTGAEKWINRLKEFKENNVWTGQAATMGELMPLLSDVKIVTGEAATTPKILDITAPAKGPDAAIKPAATSAKATTSTTPATPAVTPITPAPKPASDAFTGFVVPTAK